MGHILWFVFIFAAGVAVGFIFRALIAKDANVTKLELSDWAQQLRNAAVADASMTKNVVQMLIAKVEKKL